MEPVHILLTGGTIEKSYDPQTEKPEFQGSSVVPDYLLRTIKVYPVLSFETICQIDSLDMDDFIRKKILLAIQGTSAMRVLVVHGTSTMTDTAAYLSHRLQGLQKTVVLTGAMIPMKEFAMSDGGFNLGFALAEVLSKPSGVYVSMNARSFPAGQVTKNVTAGRFEGLSS